MKAICIIRTSTDRQHIEEQTTEVVQMAKADGFKEEDIEVIGKCGASAIKLDEAYLENLTRLYERLESGDVACVYAWAIDRIGRDEVTLFQFKQVLEKKKIQLKIKNPSLTLFNVTVNNNSQFLTINPGVELAFSLYATMAKQEMIHKKERFARGKRQSGRAEKYTGGSIAFGYSVNDSGKYIVNEDEADIVRKIYDMYLSGKYSLKTLTDEVRKRGLTWRNDKPFTLARIRLILYNTCYIGISGGAKIQQFPRIISDDLYNKVREVLAMNKTAMTMESKHSYFANKLIKCPECGYSYSANGRIYRCVKHSNNKAWSIGKTDYTPCNNDVCISIEAMDGLLYKVARDAHRAFIMSDLASRKEYIHKENTNLSERKSGLEKSLENYTRRRKIIYDGYADLIYTEEEYRQKLKKLDEEFAGIRNEILSIEERINRNEQMLNTDSKFDQVISAITLTRGYFISADEKAISELVHMYVRSIKLERYTEEMQLNSITHNIRKEMSRMEGLDIHPVKAATLITIEYTNGHTDKFVYYARRKEVRHRFQKMEGGLEVPFLVEFMTRDNRGCYNEELRLSAEIIRRARELQKRGVNISEITQNKIYIGPDKDIAKLMDMISDYVMVYKSHEYLAIINIIRQ